MPIVHLTRDDLAERPIAEAITTRGKELSVDDTVAAARTLFLNDSVMIVPVLDGTAYVGALDRQAVIAGVPDSTAVGPLAASLVPTVIATTPTSDALDALDCDGSRRLVVLAPDGSTFVGVVCIRSDRRRLCVDAGLTPE
jgi:predicted transcriptional regulator